MPAAPTHNRFYGVRARGPASAYAMNYLSLTIDIPQRPYDIVTRHWNRLVKNGMRRALEKHDRERIPLHFRQDARHRYGYKPRTDAYRAWKKRKLGSTRDLVKTGASEKRMKHERQIILGGAAEGGKKPLVGRLRKKFAWTEELAKKEYRAKRFVRRAGGWYDKAQDKSRGGVSIADMKREIQAFTAQERAQFADDFWTAVWEEYAAYSSKRKRIKIGKA